MAGTNGLVVEAETLQRIGSEVRQEDVCIVEEPVELRHGLLSTKVEHDASLAPVVELIRRHSCLIDAEIAEEVAHGVTGRPLDLDHLGAPVGEDASRPRSCHPDRQLDDTHTGQHGRRP